MSVHTTQIDNAAAWTKIKEIFSHITSHPILLTAIIVVSISILFAIAAAIAVAIIYIKTSWVDRGNSKNLTGGELARKILDKNGMKSTTLKPAWIYIKYWNHSKRKDTFKLRPWTVNRKSIWTMTEAAQQTVVSTWRSQHGKLGMAFKIFRFPTLIKILASLLAFASAGITFWLLHSQKIVLNTPKDLAKIAGILSFILLLIASLIAWADVLKLAIIRKKVTPHLLEQGFNKKEIKAFRMIYTSRLVLAIAIAILTTIRMILRLISSLQSEQKNN